MVIFKIEGSWNGKLTVVFFLNLIQDTVVDVAVHYGLKMEQKVLEKRQEC